MPPTSITPEEILNLLRDLPATGETWPSDAARLEWLSRKDALLDRLAAEVAGDHTSQQVPAPQ